MFFLIQIKAVLAGIFFLFGCLFPVGIIAAPFPLRRRLKIICPAWGVFGKGLLRFACQAKIDISEDHRSKEFAQVPAYGLYIANHQSYLDIPLMATVYQLPPIMKKEVLFIPVFGWLAWVSGSMPVSRSDAGSRKKVFARARRRIVHEKIGLQVYPEGTRSRTGLPKEYSEIKRTLMVFAYNEKIPVIPTSLYGTRGVLTREGFVRPNRHLGIIVHKEIDPKDFATSDEFCRACWAKVIEGHDRMKAQLGPKNENLSLA